MEVEQVEGVSELRVVKGLRGKKKSSAGFVMMGRDLEALRFVLEQGVVTVEQLWRAVWWSEGSKSSRYAAKRVLLLERSGYLVGERSHLIGATLYRATSKAWEHLCAVDGRVHPKPLLRLNHLEIEHSLKLTALRVLLTQAGKVASWKSERVLLLESRDGQRLRADRESHPDALWGSISGRRILIEVELSPKTQSRLKRKIERYRANLGNGYDFVLWLAGSVGIKTQIEKHLAGTENQRVEIWSDFIAEFKKEKV